MRKLRTLLLLFFGFFGLWYAADALTGQTFSYHPSSYALSTAVFLALFVLVFRFYPQEVPKK